MKYFYIFFPIGLLISCSSSKFYQYDTIKFVQTPTFKYSLEEIDDQVEKLSRGKWWKGKVPSKYEEYTKELSFNKIARDKVIAFSTYTVHKRTMKLSVQFYPLYDDEEKNVYLDLFLDGSWQEIGKENIPKLGWSALFRVENWLFEDQDIQYRVRHDKGAKLEGIIRRNPKDKKEIVVASLSCIHHRGKKEQKAVKDIIANLKIHKPDLLFFAGDQTYFHKEHTAGWLLFGSYFRDILKDYPSVIIPDDHDVGQSNLWGTGGHRKATTKAGSEGGYYRSVSYVNMVQRAQTSHLPDPYDDRPLDNGIGVYYTSLNLGGISFAILEDRKWKSSPADLGTRDKLDSLGFWKEKKDANRLDHVTNPEFDISVIDVDKLTLIGERQHSFLNYWIEDWTNAEMKVVLSQTPFASLAHKHGGDGEAHRLVADLDSNGWPQTQRRRILKTFRKALAVHISGDQHLMTLVQHGIDNWNDGVWSFVSPAMGYGVYERNWEPLQKSPVPLKNSPLEYTGQFLDSLKNKITMHSYANQSGNDAISKGLGYSLIRFNKEKRKITFESYPRFQQVDKPNVKQFLGVPKTINQWDNDGRKIVGYLPKLIIDGENKPVIQVINEKNSEILYTLRLDKNHFKPPVYDLNAMYSIKIGKDFPNLLKKENLKIAKKRNKKIYFSLR